MKNLAKFLTVLNANNRPWEVALALSFGLMLSFFPPGALFMLLMFIFGIPKVHLPTLAFSAFLFQPLGIALSYPFHQTGEFLLSASWTEGLRTALMNIPLASLLEWNNTRNFGALVIGFLTLIPTFFLFKALIKFYRQSLKEIMSRWKIFKIITNLPMIKGLKQQMDLWSSVLQD